MTPLQILAALRAAGVQVWLEEGDIHYQAPRSSAGIDALLRQLAEHKQELAAFFLSSGDDDPDQPLQLVTDSDNAPVSFEQQRFLFLHEFEGVGQNYNLLSCFRLKGRLNIHALQHAVAAIVDRHAILRTRFQRENAEWRQYRQRLAIEVAVQDLSGLQKSYQDQQVGKQLQQHALTRFNLVDGPHLRLTLLRLSNHEHLLLVVMHHIVSDGHSIRLFVDGLRQAYVRFLRGGEVSAVDAPADDQLQYQDYAWWQHRHIRAQGIDADLDYWREHLRGAPPLLSLDTAASRPARPGLSANTVNMRIEPTVWSSIQAVCSHRELTPFHCLMAAYVLSLSRYSGESDIVVGSPANTRRQVNASGLIGPFINMLALRFRIDGAESVQDFLQQVRHTVVHGLDHSMAPFEKVVEALAPQRSVAHAPLFQHLFVLEDAPLDIIQLPGLEISVEPFEPPTAKYDTALIVQRDARGYFLTLRYREELFNAAAMSALAQTFLYLLEQLPDHLEAPLAALQALRVSERRILREALAGQAQDHFGRCCLHQLVEQQCDKTPDRVALQFAGDSRTYAQLEQRANQTAHWLQTQGVKPGMVVGMALDNSFAMVYVLLAIGKCGAVYLPVATDDPPARINYCLKQADAQVIVTRADWPIAAEVSATCLSTDERGSIDAMPVTRPETHCGPDGLLNILYTSGSTGQPKAVMTRHAALVNNLQWMQRRWPLRMSDGLLLKAPLTFDVSAKEIFWPLMVGGRLVISRPGGRHDPAYLWRAIHQYDVTVVHLVPTMLDYFIAESKPEVDTGLRIVMCGGEALGADLLRRFHTTFKADLLHLYGPTEAAIAITGCVLPRDGLETLPLGQTTDNSSVYLLDQDLSLTPPGVLGEIFIGGLAVADGYYGQPAKTADAFRPDPFAGYKGARMYATGDLARVTRQHDLLFAGRRDHQVKLYGQRIEPGEIEAALKQHPKISDAVVMTVSGASGRPALKAFLVCAGERPAHTELNTFLRRRLSARMLPAGFVYLNEIPKLPNGKIDRQRLSATTAPKTGSEAGTMRVMRETERQLMVIWAELLQRDEVGIHENFFEAGGHSLLAIELRDRIQSAFGCELDVADIFAHASIEAQARFLQSGHGIETADADLSTTPGPLNRSDSNSTEPVAGFEPIAVIGMSGRFPGADDLQAFWDNIEAGRDSITRFSADELLAAGYPENLIRQDAFVPARAALCDIERFDAGFFGFTPIEAALLDPQHRLLLECGQLAFDDAGYSPERLARRGQRVGVYVGISNSGYYENNLARSPGLMEKYGSLQLALSTAKSYAATQLAFRLNLRGPAVSLDTACSTSLVAIVKACQSLQLNESELALAGGASINVPVAGGHLWQEAGVGSKDGRCRPFDVAGSGTVKGMGGGMVLLKKLAEAQRDADPIHAVILGSALNNDGADKVGFTAPSVSGQRRVMKKALRQAGVAPESIGFIETHGTGTQLGDPIEIKSLSSVYTGDALVLGAVKGNIGHLDAAAGVAGFIKAVLTLKRKTFPPMANFTAPNQQLESTSGKLRIMKAAAPWPDAESTRRAAVSSFGIGGTNAHAVLQEAPAEPAGAISPEDELLLLSANSPEALAQSMQHLQDYLQSGNAAPLPAISYTLGVGRTHYRYRHVLVAGSRQAALQEYSRRLETGREEQAADMTSAAAIERPRVVFMFAGQGSGIDLAVRAFYARDAVFTQALDEALETLADLSAFDFKAHLGRITGPAGQVEYLRDVAAIQPWQFAVSMALVSSLQALGIRPDACLGHSLGEYAAACAAGAMSVHDGLAILTRRGQLVAECEPGAMLALACSEAQTVDLLGQGSEVELAAVNSPAQCIVSGPRAAIKQLRQTARGRQIACRQLPTDRAFHSAMMEPVLERFRQYLQNITFSAPEISLACNVSGQLMNEQVLDADYWCQHLRQCVRFMPAMSALHQTSPDVLLEIGAGNTLCHFATANPDCAGQIVARPVLDRSAHSELPAAYLQALGTLWQRGVPIDWDGFFRQFNKRSQAGYRRTNLPGYPFQRVRHWIDPPALSAGPSILPAEASGSACRTFSWAKAPMLPVAAVRPDTLLLHDAPDMAEQWQSLLGRTCRTVLMSTNMQPDALSLDPAVPVHIICASARLLKDVDQPLTPEWLAAFFDKLEAIARMTGVASISIPLAGTIDVSGSDQQCDATRALLAGQLAHWASHLRQSKADIAVRIIDISLPSNDMEVAAIASELQGHEWVLVALRKTQRWLPVSLDMELPDTLPGRVIPADHHCCIWSEQLALTAALDEHLRQHGARDVDTQPLPAGSDTDNWRQRPVASLFVLLPEAQAAEGGNPDFWCRSVQLLKALQQVLHQQRDQQLQICVFVPASLAEGGTTGLLSAIRNLFNTHSGSLRYLIVVSSVWRDAAYPQPMLSAALDAVSECLIQQPNNEIHITPQAVAYRAADKRKQPPEAAAPTVARPSSSSSQHAPMTDMEQQVAGLWADLLGLDQVGAEDNFFDLGGDSLLASQSVSQLHSQLGVRIAIATFVSHASVRQIAGIIDNVQSVGSTDEHQSASENAIDTAASGRDQWEL